MRACCILCVLALYGGLAAPVAAESEPAFRALMKQNPATKLDVCRNAVITEAVKRWRVDHQPSDRQNSAFASVDEIRREVDGGMVAEKGCNTAYLWSVLHCASVDAPNQSPAIRPRGVSAETPEKMADLLRRCLIRSDKILGLSPTR